jgi:hypothetical protein
MRVQGGIISALQRTTLAELVEFSRCSDPVAIPVPAAVSLPIVSAG